MPVFVSYSSRDRALLQGLLVGLRRAHQQVWFDEDLSGGDAWWRAILEQIRSCEVFIVALSENWLESKACRSEFQYAQALGKPMLPVQVGAVDSTAHPFTEAPVIDYRVPNIDTGIELVKNVHTRRAEVQPLPDPLPPEPPIPFAYLMRLAADISAPALGADEQESLVKQLKAGLDEDGDDESARQDLTQLLCMLRDRPDVTYRTRTEVETLLTQWNSPHTPTQTVEQPVYTPPTTYQTVPEYQPAYQPPADPQPTAEQPQYFGQVSTTQPPRRPESRRTWLLAGGGVAVAAIVAVVLVLVVIAMSGNGGSEGPTLPSSSLPSVLLSSDDVGSIIGVTGLTATEVINHTTEPVNPNDACAWLDGTGSAKLYEGSGYTAIADQAFRGPDTDPVWAAQTVVAFGSADQASAMVNSTEDKMRECAGKTYSQPVEGEADQYWSLGDVTRSDAQVVQKSAMEGGKGYTCQHLLRAMSNTVIEVNTCGDNIGDEANRIADKIAEKVTAELNK